LTDPPATNPPAASDWLWPVAPSPTPQSPSNDGRPDVRPMAGTPLQDPRSHPATRTLADGLITAGRGQAPNAQTFAGLQR
jgi:hypothetical protein